MDASMLTGTMGLRVSNGGLADVWETTTKPKIEYAELSDTYGKFIVEPLERGFGVTLGNALRRVLLSSIGGAPVTSGEIEDVLPEFSPIPGGGEDVPPRDPHPKEADTTRQRDNPHI